MRCTIDYIQVPYIILEFEEHLTVKPILLEKIASTTGVKLNNEDHCISDFYQRENNTLKYNNFNQGTRDYANYITPFISRYAEVALKDFDVDKLFVKEIWFQQYYKMNYHNWHDHISSHWAAIYYLELDVKGPKTLFRNLSGEIIEPDIKEGDIIIFPSFLKHKSPSNKTNNRKTVIACNIDEVYNV